MPKCQCNFNFFLISKTTMKNHILSSLLWLSNIHSFSTSYQFNDSYLLPMAKPEVEFSLLSKCAWFIKQHLMLSLPSPSPDLSKCLFLRHYSIFLLSTFLNIGEGNSNSLQYSCLENPMDRGMWQAYGPRSREEMDTTEWPHVFLNISKDLPSVCLLNNVGRKEWPFILKR